LQLNKTPDKSQISTYTLKDLLRLDYYSWWWLPLSTNTTNCDNIC